jgi:uncharacterized protein (DUF58 family)
MTEKPGHVLQRRGEALAARLPPLLAAAERVAATVAQGVHGRRRIGQGETFWQFREYEPGDRTQLIDWRQTAKRETVFVRELEWEAAQSIWLWRDTSASMSWRSGRNLPRKRERADILLLALIVLLIRAGEHVTLFGSEQAPASGRSTLARIALEIERAQEEIDEAGLPPREDLPRRAQIVLIGDFLGPLEELEAAIAYYAERNIKGHLLQILDPAERSLPYEGRIRFEGTEGEQPWLVGRVDHIRQAYRERLDLHCAGIVDLARRAGWGSSLHLTDHSAESALLTLYAALGQQAGGWR